MLRVNNLKLSLDEDKSDLPAKIAKKLKILEKQILEYKIFRESVDARKAKMIFWVYTVDITVDNEKVILSRYKGKDVAIVSKDKYEEVLIGNSPLNSRPVIIGMGPCGLFAGLLLAYRGYKPLLLEQGEDIDSRTSKVKKFWQKGILDTKSNVQFGEGGAGTFSDGKLTTLIKDKRCRWVLEEMVKVGADEEILYSFKPHVGTDRLRLVVKALRQKIIDLGGEVRFNSRVSDIFVERSKEFPLGELTGILVNEQEKIAGEALIVALGHSARDTFQMLFDKGIKMEQKPFSLGVRVEHSQRLINEAQYKEFANHPKLGPAEYKLVYHSPSGRSAYTFCMCPGGVVVAAASEEGRLVTNGMSFYARDLENANSALLVGIRPQDFGSEHPLAGIAFQRHWEEKAFLLGGGKYLAPAQLMGDFLNDCPSKALGEVRPSYSRGIKLAELKNCLPSYVVETLKEAIVFFEQKLKGFSYPKAILTGVETRSSSPVRILRNEKGCSSVKGVYPAGEGAGYAGGIISAAVDGVKIAEEIIKEFKNFA